MPILMHLTPSCMHRAPNPNVDPVSAPADIRPRVSLQAQLAQRYPNISLISFLRLRQGSESWDPVRCRLRAKAERGCSHEGEKGLSTLSAVDVHPSFSIRALHNPLPKVQEASLLVPGAVENQVLRRLPGVATRTC